MKTILVYVVCSGVFLSVAMAEPRIPADGEREEGKGLGHKKGERGGGPGGRGLMFKKMDVNEDGQISKEEFFAVDLTERVPEEKRDSLYARLDRDKDGVISKAEIEVMRKRHEDKRRKEFRELDTDEKRGLSFEEFSKGQFFSKLPEEKRQEIFERMDTDGDGVITPEDHPRPPRERGDDRRRGE